MKEDLKSNPTLAQIYLPFPGGKHDTKRPPKNKDRAESPQYY